MGRGGLQRKYEPGASGRGPGRSNGWRRRRQRRLRKKWGGAAAAENGIAWHERLGVVCTVQAGGRQGWAWKESLRCSSHGPTSLASNLGFSLKRKSRGCLVSWQVRRHRTSKRRLRQRLPAAPSSSMARGQLAVAARAAGAPELAAGSW